MSESATATQFGSPRSFFRTYARGTTPPAFVPFTGPVSLSGPDGVYQLDYFSLDSLNNPEPVKSSVFTLDNTPPAITCPSNIVTNTSDPGDATVAVTYGAPQASDSNSTPTVVCSPPSGSRFTRGVTSVSCTATDEVNNASNCAFAVTIFDYVIVDDSSGEILRFDSATGDYDFFDCRKGASIGGRGTVVINSCKTHLQASGEKGSGLNVTVLANFCTKVGDATVTYAGLTHTLHDPNMSNNISSCP